MGQVDHEEIFESLKDFDEKISAKGPLSPMTRPWTAKVAPLEESVNKLVEYGADDEDSGMVRKRISLNPPTTCFSIDC